MYLRSSSLSSVAVQKQDDPRPAVAFLPSCAGEEACIARTDLSTKDILVGYTCSKCPETVVEEGITFAAHDV